MIRTLIVEDDFRVARLYAEVVAQMEDFSIAGTVHTASAALDVAGRVAPDLVLLDLYLPDASGLDVLRRLRGQGQPLDVIVLSAARDMQSVRSAMQAGAVQYLIKPFDYDDLRARLKAYAELYEARSGERETGQQEVDRLFALARRPAHDDELSLPKGHSTATAELVLATLRDAGGPLSATEVSDRVGISRTTAQRYLTTLADAGMVRRNLRYGTAGRPEHRYEAEPARP